MGEEKTLLNRFYQEFWIFLMLLIFSVILILVLMIFYFLKIKDTNKDFKFATPIIILFFTFLTVLLGTYFTKYYKDYVYLKTHSPIQIEGELIGYSNSVSPDDLTVAKSWPIIMLKDGDEKVILNIIDAEKKLKENQVYMFLYLPNTRIAEVIERNTN